MIGLGRPSGQAILVAAWYLGLTAVVLAFAYRDRGIRRSIGILVIAAYAVFAGALLASAGGRQLESRIAIAASVAVAVVAGGWLVLGRRPDSGAVRPEPGPRSWSWLDRESLLPGWSVRRIWVLGMALTCAVAVTDAGLGRRAVLIGLLIIGPCCVQLTGRWVPTGLTGLGAVGLATVLSLPDGIWGTGSFVAWLAAVAVVASVSTIAAALIENRRSAPGC